MKLMLKAGLTGLACLAALAVAAPVYALRIAAQPIPLRVAQAEVVVGGKVTKIEDKTVSINKAEYQIAVVKVSDPILNAKGIKEMRVGFLAPPAAPNPGGPIIRPGFRPGITLIEDEELVLLLTKSGEKDIYLIQGWDGAIKKANNEAYDKQVEEVKKAAKLLVDPKASLKSKDADERLETAAMLIERHRTPKPPFTDEPKQEPIDAEESKLILAALRDADWNPAAKPGVAAFMRITPLNSFFRLGLTKEDKWELPVQQPGQPPVNINELAQKWLKDNADTYRIKKFVSETKDDKKDEKKDK